MIHCKTVFESALLVFVLGIWLSVYFFNFIILVVFFWGGGWQRGVRGQGGVTLYVDCLKVLHDDFGAFYSSLGISELHLPLFVWTVHQECNFIISCHIVIVEYPKTVFLLWKRLWDYKLNIFLFLIENNN